MLRALTLSLLLSLAAAPAASAALERPKFRTVVFGDSYGSGEGAPAEVGNYGADGSDLGSPSPAADWNGSATDAAFTGDSASAAKRCHRSPLATSARAVQALQTQFSDIDFTFRSLACSGARIDRGVLGGYEGVEPADTSNLLRRQVEQANTYIDGLSSDKRINALVMNIGGNNLGFANIIQRCTNLPPFPFDPCSPPDFSDGGAGNEDARNVLLTGQGGDADPGVLGLDDLPFQYGALDASIDGRSPPNPTDTRPPLSVRPGRVFLTGPPNPIAGGFTGCLNGPHDYEKNLRNDEINWVRTEVYPALVNAMSQAATTNGWEFVNMQDAVTRGLCDPGNRQINRNRDSLLAQGATVANAAGIGVSHGWVHPNAGGYAAMAPVLSGAMRSHVIGTFTPGAPTGGVPAEVVELRPRVELRVNAPSQTYPTRPAAVVPAGAPGATTTVDGALGVGSGVVEVPTPTNQNTLTLQARRCGPVEPAPLPEGCGSNRGVTGVLAGTPSAPASATSRPDPLGIRVSWTRGTPSSVTLRRFHITATRSRRIAGLSDQPNPTDQLAGCSLENQFNAGGSGPLPGGQSGCGNSGTLLAGEFDRPIVTEFSVPAKFRETVIDVSTATDTTITVRECTDRGCGTGRGAGTVRSGSANATLQQIQASLATPTISDLERDLPVGVFTTQARQRARAGRVFPLRVAWAAWRRWRDLRTLDLRLLGQNGELGTITVALRSGRVTFKSPGTRTRRGRLGRRGTLRAGDVSLRTRTGRIVAASPRSRLVALELPLALSRRLARQRVDVEIAATARGKKQDFGWAGSFEVVRR